MLTGVVCASCLPLAKTLRSFGVAVDAYETAAPTFARSRSQQRGCDRFSLTDAANAAVTVHGMAHSLPLPKMGVCPPPPLVLVPVVGFQCKTPKNLGHISVDTTYKNVNRRFYDTVYFILQRLQSGNQYLPTQLLRSFFWLICTMRSSCFAFFGGIGRFSRHRRYKLTSLVRDFIYLILNF